jgi:hypothetical protein
MEMEMVRQTFLNLNRAISLPAGEPPDELLVDVPERDYSRPALGLKTQEHRLGLLGAQSQAPSVSVCHAWCAMVDGNSGLWHSLRSTTWDVQQPQQLQW